MFLECLNVDIKPSVGSIPCKSEHDEDLRTLAKKGNEGKGCKEPHTCYICLQICSRRHRLVRHLENVHFSSKKTMRCDVCDFCTADSSFLKRHKRTHFPSVECPICKKQMTSPESHKLAHDKTKEKCSVCQMMIQKKHMQKHMKTSHSSKKCKHCEETFENKEDLRR